MNMLYYNNSEIFVVTSSILVIVISISRSWQAFKSFLSLCHYKLGIDIKYACLFENNIEHY